jgi:hypothetical protein
MDIKKVLITGVIIFAVVFLLASVLLFVVALQEPVFGIIMIVLSSTIVYAVVRYYYMKDITLDNPLKDGIVLGIAISLVVFILEAITMVYGFAADEGWAYFTRPTIMIGYLIMVLIPVVAAYLKK